MRLYFNSFLIFLKAVKTKSKLILHFITLIIEAVGTFLVFLETMRLNARAPVDALGTIGDPLQYRYWWYHCGVCGFSFLLAGIIFQAILIFSRDYELENIERRIKRLETVVQSKEHQAVLIQNGASDSYSI
jgi:hypothetical protein